MSITIRTFKILKGRFKIHKDKCILNHNAIFQVNRYKYYLKNSASGPEELFIIIAAHNSNQLLRSLACQDNQLTFLKYGLLLEGCVNENIFFLEIK